MGQLIFLAIWEHSILIKDNHDIPSDRNQNHPKIHVEPIIIAKLLS